MENNQGGQKSSPAIDSKLTGIIAYLGLIGFVIAYVAGDKEGAKFHLNQALVINLAFLITAVPIIGWLLSIPLLILWIMGLIAAINEEEKPIPVLGSIKILK